MLIEIATRKIGSTPSGCPRLRRSEGHGRPKSVSLRRFMALSQQRSAKWPASDISKQAVRATHSVAKQAAGIPVDDGRLLPAAPRTDRSRLRRFIAAASIVGVLLGLLISTPLIGLVHEVPL